MTKVVIVGEIYNADLSVGGGPMPGGGGQPSHPIYNPVYPSHPIYNPAYPSHPIAPGGGGPVDPGYGIDTGHRPTHPIYNPAYPAHPIYNPAYPDNTLPQPPLGTWGGGNVPFPTPPIYIPPQAPPVAEGKAHVVAYVPNTSTGKVERITFTVDMPDEVPPTEATPKA